MNRAYFYNNYTKIIYSFKLNADSVKICQFISQFLIIVG